LRLVPLADARRPDQSLGAHLAALRSGRLPAQEPRRARRRLADYLRRHQAVLRRGRQIRRYFRQQPRSALSQRARRLLPAAAAAALLRTPDKEGIREAEHSVRAVAAVEPDQADQRRYVLTLIRNVR